jgi:hypothetical protein
MRFTWNSIAPAARARFLNVDRLLVLPLARDPDRVQVGHELLVRTADEPVLAVLAREDEILGFRLAAHERLPAARLPCRQHALGPCPRY